MGRYKNTTQVLRGALRLMKERERRLAAPDAAIGAEIADGEVGRIDYVDHVCEEPLAELEMMPD